MFIVPPLPLTQLDPDAEPFIAHVQPDGFTTVHSHPKALNGTKFFEWGWNEFGLFNQVCRVAAWQSTPTVGVPF